MAAKPFKHRRSHKQHMSTHMLTHAHAHSHAHAHTYARTNGMPPPCQRNLHQARMRAPHISACTHAH
eukprot:10674310-Alexandrium_andersonii.AAC.1